MKVEDGKITFSSGRWFRANLGIVGLSEPGEDGWNVTEGYDGGVSDFMGSAGSDHLQSEDARELADYMIGLWSRFRKVHE